MYHQSTLPFSEPPCGHKRCTKCEKTLPLADFFDTSARQPGSYTAECRTCHYERAARYRNQNKGKIASRARVYRQVNAERIAEYTKIYRQENRESCAERVRSWEKRHPEARKAISKRWRESHPESHRRTYNNWARQNRSKVRELYQRRTARMYQSPKIEKIDRDAVVARHGPHCYLCGQLFTAVNLQLDHVMPISRGGEHTERNLRPCCKSCNCRKKDYLWEELVSRDSGMAEKVRMEVESSVID